MRCGKPLCIFEQLHAAVLAQTFGGVQESFTAREMDRGVPIAHWNIHIFFVECWCLCLEEADHIQYNRDLFVVPA